MIQATHMPRNPLAAGLLVGLAVAAAALVCLAVLWAVVAGVVGLAG